MKRPERRILLVMLLALLLAPPAGIAGGVGTDTPPPQQDQSVNDTVSGPIQVLPQVPDIKFHDAGAPQETTGNSTNAAPEEHKDRIKVVYDTETEQDRGKMIALVIAFGISLALNIYLATALFTARRRM